MNLRKIISRFTIIASIALITLAIPVSAKSTYTVKQDGTGDFTSISEGVAAVPHGSTLTIYPGIYNEHVDIIGKTVNLIGIDKNTCILQFDTSNYYAVPLNFSTGTVKNLTIKGYRSSPLKVSQKVTRPEDKLGTDLTDSQFDAYTAYIQGKGEYTNPLDDSYYVSNPEEGAGYAIHLDQDFIYGQSANIINCNIISEHASCIGMGLRGGAKVNISGCSLSSLSQGIVFFHDTDKPGLTGNCSLSFNGCAMESNGSFFIMCTALSPLCNVNLTFNNNVVSGNTNSIIANMYEGPGLGWMGLNNYFLTSKSKGNNVDFLNIQ